MSYALLVAPASPFSPEKFDTACGILEGRGYRLAPGKNIFRKLGYLAGTEAERAEDLIDAITNPEVSAIISIRGGFGSSRLLPWLPFSLLQKSRKIFMGYSDTTCLHLALLAKTRRITFHGPNLIEMADFPEVSVAALNKVRDTCEKSIPQSRHCKQCRADAVGIPGLAKLSSSFRICSYHAICASV